jgi:hypothetical protein
MAKQSDENTRQIIQWQNNQTKIQTTCAKTLHKKLKIEQHEPH